MTIKNDISFRFSENDLRNGADVIMIINLPVRCKIISVRIYRKNLQTQKKNLYKKTFPHISFIQTILYILLTNSFWILKIIMVYLYILQLYYTIMRNYNVCMIK